MVKFALCFVFIVWCVVPLACGEMREAHYICHLWPNNYSIDKLEQILSSQVGISVKIIGMSDHVLKLKKRQDIDLFSLLHTVFICKNSINYFDLEKKYIKLICLDRLNEKHLNRTEARKAKISLILGTSLSRAELDAVSRENYEKYKESMSNSSEVILGTSLSRAELDAVSRENYEKYKESMSNSSEVILGTSLSRAELDAIVSQSNIH